MPDTKKIELLAPAKNLEYGIAAIDCGADALYIGAPLFGARVAAGNSIDDIKTLTEYAHLFGAKVFATVNTLLLDNEIDDAARMIWQLYDSGVDAAIIQDMALLDANLPPIELHASTQTHNIDIRRVKFLEQVGFRRIILARETSLAQMRALRQECTADLEAFVHGALCVCYSGQCYLSQYLTGRSGNRGACAQPCRSAYDLVNGDGKTLVRNGHLLSLKDFSAAQHIESMIDAGITSFKIEGRLKDLSYVKNITAYYRRLIDGIAARRSDVVAASTGTTTLDFQPDPARTFNRGYTDYFLVDRHSMASHTTQKSLGKEIGKVIKSSGNRLIVRTEEQIVPGDGMCFFNDDGILDGFLVNHADSNSIEANKPLAIKPGTQLWRNNDFLFEKKLQGKCSERKIAVSMTLTVDGNSLSLTVTDSDGLTATCLEPCIIEPARDEARARESITRQLTKLGGTPFEAASATIIATPLPFIAASVINELRRKTIALLRDKRIAHFRPKDSSRTDSGEPYFESTLDGRANIVNLKAEEFYRRHGIKELQRGPDQPGVGFDGKNETLPLMTTKYCLRYELGQCLMHKCNNVVSSDFAGELYLRNNGKTLQLRFDCQRCEMSVMDKN